MKNKNNKSGCSGCLYGVGVGPGSPDLLTLRAIRVLKEVDVVFHAVSANRTESISGKIVDSVKGCNAHRVELVFSMAPNIEDRISAWKDNALLIAKELRKGNNCAFVTIGDPLIYSTYTYIVREVGSLIDGLKTEVVPGITAFQEVAANANISLVEDKEVLAIVPAWTTESTEYPFINTADTVVLLKTYRYKNKILKTLKEHGFNGDIIYAARVGLEGEVITEDIDKIIESPDEYLSMLVVKRTNNDRDIDW